MKPDLSKDKPLEDRSYCLQHGGTCVRARDSWRGPALTTATHPVELIAAAAIRAALHPHEGAETRFGSQLVVRQSA